MTESTPPESMQRETWQPNQQARYASEPTRWTRFMRIFTPFQLWRFLVINFKMLRVIWKGH